MDIQENNSDSQDILYSKVIDSLEDSKNILHKKALILVKSLHSQYDSKSLIGIDGIQLYTKIFIDLLLKLVEKYSNVSEENLDDDELIEDNLNYEALIFTLAICCKQLSNKILHNVQLIKRVQTVINFALGNKNNSFKINIYCHKYVLNIIESFILSRTDNELNDMKDEIILFYKNIYMKIFISTMKMKKDFSNKEELNNMTFTIKELQSNLIKNICNLISKKGDLIKFTITGEIVTFIKEKIQNINNNLKIYNSKEKENFTNTMLNAVNKNEITNILLYLSGLIQFLPQQFFNDILKQLMTLIENLDSDDEDTNAKNNSNIDLMINCLLCIDMSVNTHETSEDFNEKMLTVLLNKNIFNHLRKNNDELNTENNNINENKKYNVNGDIYDKLIISYIKTISSVLIKVSNNNYFKSLQYFIGILSKYSEVLLASNSFVINSIFNVLQDTIQKLFDKTKISNLKISGVINTETQYTMNKFLEIEYLDINEKKTGITENNILSKISKIILYFISSRFKDKKIGYNLLLLFIEKINNAKQINKVFEEHINTLNEQILFDLSEINEKEKIKSDLHKIFIGKCFNYINSTLILKYYPLGILDYDIEKDDYTDSSNVWIISYIDKFLLKEEGIQTIEDYVKCFMNSLNELEHMIIKLKVSPTQQEKNENNKMDEEEDSDNDEKFEVNKSETKHVRDLKIKRYQLIMTQLFSQIVKFTNYCNNYSQYIDAFIAKFKGYFENNESCQFLVSNLYEIAFKFLYKIIYVSNKHNDKEAMKVIRENGVFFFEKILNLLLKNKLNKSETQLGYNVISQFCLVLTKQDIIKIIIDMIQKFDSTVNEIFNNNDDNKNNNKIINTKNNDKKQKEKNDKEINKLAIRLEISNYLLRNIDFTVNNPTNNNNNTDESNMVSILLQFFDKYFFFFSDNKNVKINKNGISSLQPLLTKKFFDIFYEIISKCNDIDYLLDIFSKFTKDKKGLTLISSKQQSKLYEFIISKIIKKYSDTENLKFENMNISLELLIALVSLTKDINKKVRNTAFDIIGNITSFCTKKNIFNDWLKINISLLSSKNSFVESSCINALARIFWENRDLNNTTNQIIENSEAVYAYFPFNNKEILKSIFLYIRVLLYIIKIHPINDKNKMDSVIHKIIFCTTQQMNEQNQKEFKVKMRNLFKNLIINYGYDYVKNEIDPKNENIKNFVQYVNKNIVKKFSSENNENTENLNNDVMLDNENNLIDEEEDFIKNEFYKNTKNDKENIEKKFYNKIGKLNINENDPNEERQKELEELKKKEISEKNSNLDKIEELFKKDNVELNNFFYVNPFATANYTKYDEQQINKENQKEKNDKKDNKDSNNKEDVFYDAKQGKFIIKDLEKEIEISKLNKKRKRMQNDEKLKEIEYQNNELLKQAKTKGKKNKKQNDDLDDLDNDDLDEDKITTKKKKVSNKNSGIKTFVDNDGKKTSHYVKYSGDEYKSKKGKGDKIIQGKYEPFAYIQLNPKSLNNKGERENNKIWSDIMKNGNK